MARRGSLPGMRGAAKARLCARYRRLSATGKKLPIVVAAIRALAVKLLQLKRDIFYFPPRRAGGGARKVGNSRR